MKKFKTILQRFILKLSIKYLLFIFIIIIGCSYQVIHVSKVYFEYETKIDVKYNQKSEIVIPMVSFCRPTIYSFRNSSEPKSIKGMSPAQVYNQTYLDEIFIEIVFFRMDGKVIKVVNNFTDENQNEIQFEKTISSSMICYHFKYPNAKQLNNTEVYVYKIYLYYPIENAYPYYNLFITSDINYPNPKNDDYFKLFGIIF